MTKPLRQLSFSIAGNPVYFRAGTPDLEVINDTLVRAEYDCVSRDLQDPKFIVDCGAYAGYSSLYFLNKYEHAHVTAIEADADNFEVLSRNLAPYGERVTAIHAAVWSERTGLVLRKGELADGREWASMVTAPRPGEMPDVPGIDLGTVLRDSGFHEIDLLKANIECAETAVFSKNYEAWLGHVRNIVIQLHDHTAEEAFFRAMSTFGFFLARPPTLLTCTSISERRAPLAATTAASRSQNVLANGDFENLRAAPAEIVPGGWIPGSTDVANSWRVVVCDPLFTVSLAVRLGFQYAGENALCVRTNGGSTIRPDSAPYAAIENSRSVPVREGERWRISTQVKTSGTSSAPHGVTRGAYAFLRIRYGDGTYADLGIEPLAHVTREYRQITGVVEVPATPAGSAIQSATLWLYAWTRNSTASEIPSTSAIWDVLFDDVACAPA